MATVKDVLNYVEKEIAEHEEAQAHHVEAREKNPIAYTQNASKKLTAIQAVLEALRKVRDIAKSG